MARNLYEGKTWEQLETQRRKAIHESISSNDPEVKRIARDTVYYTNLELARRLAEPSRKGRK